MPDPKRYRLTDRDMMAATNRGADVRVMPKQVEGRVQVPDLESTLSELAHMMVAAKADYRDKISEEMDRRHRELMQRVDALVTAVGNQKAPDMSKVMRMIADIKQEHGQLVGMITEGASCTPCNYKLTFERDQRGLIDGEKGILFTAIET